MRASLTKFQPNMGVTSLRSFWTLKLYYLLTQLHTTTTELPTQIIHSYQLPPLLYYYYNFFYFSKILWKFPQKFSWFCCKKNFQMLLLCCFWLINFSTPKKHQDKNQNVVCLSIRPSQTPFTTQTTFNHSLHLNLRKP